MISFRKKKNIKLEGSLSKIIDVARFRLAIVAFIILVAFSAIGLQILNLAFFYRVEVKAGKKYIYDSDVSLARGSIYDRNGILLATNLKTSSLYANPKLIDDAKTTAQKLAKIFPDIKQEKILEGLTQDKSFVWIKRNIHPQQKYEVVSLGIPGLFFEEEEKRFYPHSNLLSHTLGIVGVDDNGLTGLEKKYDSLLKKNEDEKTHDLYLAIDVNVQSVLYNELKKQMEKHSALSAAGVVMDVNTGEVLAIASLPDFNPNTPEKMNKNSQFNKATLGLFEMGSTFKAFTLASALDSGKFKLSSIVDCTNPIKVGRFQIDDYHAKKRPMSLEEIFIYSSNIGTSRIVKVLGADVQKKYLKDFGLLDKLKTEIPEIDTPLVPKKWSEISAMTVSFGHGISVSPLHMVSAVSAVVNGGLYFNPTFVRGNIDESPRQVISQKISKQMRDLFRKVVAEGTGSKAAVAGYDVGGKTGTSEKPGGRNYDKNRLFSSFVGVFPMNDPKYVVFAVFDEPKATKDTFGYATGGWIAAPVVGSVIRQIGPILGVKPLDIKQGEGDGEQAPTIEEN
jgi:cell division protein FtsI (penicillin-binding protein 3)